MGIMDIFSGITGGSAAPAAPAPNTNANNQPQPGNIPPGAGSTNPNNPTVPAGTENKEGAPLDQFADLWKNEPASEGREQNTGLFNIDPKKMFEAAGKIDFAKMIKPEQLQAIAQGGDAAVQAFAQAMNGVAQGVYAQSAFATTKIVEQALGKAKQQYNSELPSLIKKHQVSDNLRAENPIFANPAIQPIISALEAQLTVKFPNATASEITGMAKQYVEAVGSSFAPKPAAPENDGKAGANTTDWDKFLLGN